MALFKATDLGLSMHPPLPIQVTATADAMADEQTAGLGGAAFFPDGSCGWFQFRIALAEAAEVWPWISTSMQKHIACWELLAQFVLSWMIDKMLPSSRGPVSVPQGTDNSATDASVSKALTMNGPMSDILGPYFLFMRRRSYHPSITHIPGRSNELADDLSRFADLSQWNLPKEGEFQVAWKSLVSISGIHIFQPSERWPESLIRRRA